MFLKSIIVKYKMYKTYSTSVMYTRLTFKTFQVCPFRKTKFPKNKISTKLPFIRPTLVRSFSSEVLLHNLSYSDIFMYSVYKNFVTIQLPSLFLYRVMRLSISQMAFYLLLTGITQCYIDFLKIL